jgi:hypothetical protein
MGNHVEQVNQIRTPGGRVVNFIPERATALTDATAASFEPGVLYIGVGGDVTATPAGQTGAVVFKNVPDGSFLPMYVKAIAAATTATDVLICY